MQQSIHDTRDPVDMALASHGAEIDTVFNGRYRVDRALAASAESSTLLAHDRRTGNAVVVKSIPSQLLTTGSRLRLEHEQAVFDEIAAGSPGMAHQIGRG